LVFGCLLSFLVTEVPRTFQFLSRIAPYAIFVLAALLFAVDRTGGESWYVLWGTLTALFFAALLILAVCGKEIGAGIARVAGPVALASYSLYLTHAWGLTLARNIAGRFSDAAPLLYFLVAALAIAALATLNYVLVERTSIQFRDTYWPRKLTAAATPARASLQASN
jgi:peptidoglycan/LPS O-acetylase OafA/YrhL